MTFRIVFFWLAELKYTYKGGTWLRLILMCDHLSHYGLLLCFLHVECLNFISLMSMFGKYYSISNIFRTDIESFEKQICQILTVEKTI